MLPCFTLHSTCYWDIPNLFPKKKKKSTEYSTIYFFWTHSFITHKDPYIHICINTSKTLIYSYFRIIYEFKLYSNSIPDCELPAVGIDLSDCKRILDDHFVFIYLFYRSRVSFRRTYSEPRGTKPAQVYDKIVKRRCTAKIRNQKQLRAKYIKVQYGDKFKINYFLIINFSDTFFSLFQYFDIKK